MRHRIALIIILLALVVVHGYATRVQRASAEVALLPIVMPDYVGPYKRDTDYHETAAETATELGVERIIMEHYRAENRMPVSVTIVSGGRNRRGIHFPEVCLVGAGWEIRQQARRSLGPLFAARSMVLASENDEEAVLYWFQTGTRVSDSYLANTWNWLCSPGRGTLMVRVSVVMEQRGVEQAFDTLVDFSQKLAPYLVEQARKQE